MTRRSMGSEGEKLQRLVEAAPKEPEEAALAKLLRASVELEPLDEARVWRRLEESPRRRRVGPALGLALLLGAGAATAALYVVGRERGADDGSIAAPSARVDGAPASPSVEPPREASGAHGAETAAPARSPRGAEEGAQPRDAARKGDSVDDRALRGPAPKTTASRFEPPILEAAAGSDEGDGADDDGPTAQDGPAALVGEEASPPTAAASAEPAARETRRASSPTTAVRRRSEPSPAAGARPGEEASILLFATRALRRDRDPRGALALLEYYGQRYPNGALAEEALALALDATLQLDRPAARRLAARYLERYPEGRYAARARAALAEPGVDRE